MYIYRTTESLVHTSVMVQLTGVMRVTLRAARAHAAGDFRRQGCQRSSYSQGVVKISQKLLN